ncbi:MAG: beta-ketoacyl-[acyl-carrier-protein] synthase family protein [Acidobacteriota bacterium]
MSDRAAPVGEHHSRREQAGDQHLPVITGLGAISSVGVGVDALWDAIDHGRSGAREVRSFDTSAMRNHVGCEVDDQDLERAVDQLGGAPASGGSWHDLPRASRLACAAAGEAMRAAGLEAADLDAFCLGTTTGNLLEIEDDLVVADPSRGDRVASVIHDNFAQAVARALGVTAPATTVATSCSAGNIALSQAADLVRQGQAERVVAGGADAFSRFAFVGFARMRAMATERCSPFSEGRQGMMLGEGSAFLVLESAGSAAARGVEPLAVVRGYGLSCDAHHIATPQPAGRGAAAAMTRALADADLPPEAVGYVCAHGTGTMANDIAESKACRAVFGEHRPYVSSLKALLGHSLGAASALEAVASILSLRHQRYIPAWHLTTRDERCDVDLPTAETVVDRPFRAVLNNALAFGGNNSCVALTRA